MPLTRTIEVETAAGDYFVGTVDASADLDGTFRLESDDGDTLNINGWLCDIVIMADLS